MDKSWMRLSNRFSTAYTEGVNQFISFARDHADKLNRIRCPCVKCKNGYYRTINMVENHLFIKGIDQSYTQRIFHGEEEMWNSNPVHENANDQNNWAENVNDVEEMLDDIYMGTFMDANVEDSSTSQDHALPNLRNRNFEQLWEDSQRQLHPGCEKFSKLSFIVKLLHLKTINNRSNKSFDMLIDLLRKALPDGEMLPKSYYEAKQLRRGLGIGILKVREKPINFLPSVIMAPTTIRGRGGQSSRMSSSNTPMNQLPSIHEGSSSIEESLLTEPTTLIGGQVNDGTSSEDATTSKVKRGCGKAQYLSFEKLRKNGLIPVKIESGNKGAIGTNSSAFISRVGYIARHFAPITCKNWKHIPEVDKEELYAQVREEFLLHWSEDEVRETVKAKLKRSYNDYHHALHKLFKKYSTKEEAIAHVPDELNQVDWEILCDRWADPSYKKLCDQNALNRSNLKVNHVAGSKSFARLLEEKHGEDTTLIDFYKLTHSKDGSFTTPTVEENYCKMKDLWEERNATGSSQTVEDIYKEVLGDKGLGNYIIPTPSFSRSSKVIQLTQQVEKYENEMEVYKKKWEQLEQRAESMQSKMSNMEEKHSEYDRRLSKIMAQLGSCREP